MSKEGTMDRKVIEGLKALEDTQRANRLKIINSSEYNEVSQLKTRCAILESQVEVLERQNADLKATLTHLHPDNVSSKDIHIKDGWKEVPGIGKFPPKEIVDDGSFKI
jgi:predicted nuclease with TOPRIM domain